MGRALGGVDTFAYASFSHKLMVRDPKFCYLCSYGYILKKYRRFQKIIFQTAISYRFLFSHCYLAKSAQNAVHPVEKIDFKVQELKVQ